MSNATEMKLQAITSESTMTAKKGIERWKVQTVDQRYLHEVGPFPLPTTAATAKIVAELFNGKDPFEAAFLFCVAVLRLVRVRPCLQRLVSRFIDRSNQHIVLGSC